MKNKGKLLIILLLALCAVVAAVFIVFMNKKEITYTVSFDSNGGTIVEAQTVKKGELATKPKNPTKEGNYFIEWLYNGTVFNFTEPIESDIILKANWGEVKEDEKSYIISFNTDGGSNVSTIKIKEGEKIEKPEDPTKKGYKFIKWTLNGEDYNFEKVIESDAELVAVWEKEEEKPDAKTFTVTFNSNGGSSVTTQKVTEGSKASRPTNPTKKGYVFVEWQLNNKKYDFNTKVNGNITLYADWRSIELPKPTLSYENFEQLSIAWLNKGKYTYNLLYNKDEYISKCKDLLPQGFEIYEKVNNKYNKIDDHTINQATNYVELEPGVTKTYAIRTYAIISGSERIYSAYSNDITIKTELKKPTLSYENFEKLSIPYLNNGKYMYNLLYNREDYILSDKKYNNEMVKSASGFEIYEKAGSAYTKVGDHTIDQATNYIEIEPGVTKTYAIRIYATNSSGSRVYSAYSNDITIKTELKKPTLSYENFEKLSIPYLNNGKYMYNLLYNREDYILPDEKYNNEMVKSASGFEIYEKAGSAYTKVGDHTIDQATNYIEIDPGVTKTYAIRIYATNSSGSRVYSAYSNDITIKTELKKPTLSYENFEKLSIPYLNNGKYMYNLLYNREDYILSDKKYNNEMVKSASGFEIYKKVNGTYTKVGDHTIDQATNYIEIEPGTNDTYAIRVYAVKSNQQRVYSAYSNDIIIKTELKTPTLSYSNFDNLDTPYLNNGKYIYDLLYNREDYILLNENYNGSMPSSASGFEIYEKVGNAYTKVGEHTISQATNYIEIDPGVTKTYAIRIYAINSSGSRVYSAYSNTVTINAPNRS